LDAAGVVHGGIIYCPQNRPLGELVRGIVLIRELLEPGEMRAGLSICELEPNVDEQSVAAKEATNCE
jgi:hypothetical protein